MIDDLKKLNYKSFAFVDLISDYYKKYVEQDRIRALKNNGQIVFLSDEDTVSFKCISSKIYVPKKAYSIFVELKKSPKYGVNLNNFIKGKDYLNTNTTYFDYINHVIECGLDVYDYFEESLLHETMHLCGSDGGHPFKEGINELKTRELAQKYNIKIAAMGYSKEVELAKKFQDIVGKDVMDELTFNSYNFKGACLLLEKRCGVNIVNLYKNVLDMSDNECGLVLKNAVNSGDPYEKAKIYSEIEYIETNKLLDNYLLESK